MSWLPFALQLTASALAITWGLHAWEPMHFYRLHAWIGAGLTIGSIGLVGGSIWLFRTHGPPVLRGPKRVRDVLSAALLLITFAASVALVIGLNDLGPRAAPEEVLGTLTRYTAARRASSASRTGHYGVVELGRGGSVEVLLSALEELHVTIGGKVLVVLHRGALFDWGRISSASPP